MKELSHCSSGLFSLELGLELLMAFNGLVLFILHRVSISQRIFRQSNVTYLLITLLPLHNVGPKNWMYLIHDIVIQRMEKDAVGTGLVPDSIAFHHVVYLFGVVHIELLVLDNEEVDGVGNSEIEKEGILG